MTLEEKAPIVLLLAKAIGHAKDARGTAEINYFNGVVEGLGLALGKSPKEITALQTWQPPYPCQVPNTLET